MKSRLNVVIIKAMKYTHSLAFNSRITICSKLVYLMPQVISKDMGCIAFTANNITKFIVMASVYLLFTIPPS